ncbi:MAG: hypothetical protein NVSMB46_02400 [Candidatus Saccharimonadales bacterium]
MTTYTFSQLSPIATFAVIILFTAVLAFEIWMLVDLISNNRISIEKKILWAIGMFLFHPVISILYFVFIKRNSTVG